MFELLAAKLIPTFITNVFSSVEHIFVAYQNKQITFEQLKTQVTATGIQEFAKVAAANADMVKATFGAFSQMVMSSRIVQAGYVFVLVTQALVMVWAQVGIPFMVWMYPGTSFPPSGVTLDWGYALLVLMLGGGIVAIRQPQQPNIPK